jgi:ABC-2 type transport system permease protein
MNTPSNAAPESSIDPRIVAPAASSTSTSATRPMYWSIRRELWENRSIVIAPLVVAGLFLFGFVISLGHLPERRRAVLLLDPIQQHVAIEQPYDIAAVIVILTAFLVGFFYCLDALHGERRDRTILFWKSLPVSDLTTVLSKASIPLVILPLIVFAIVVSLQLIMLAVSTVVLVLNGVNPATWEQLPLLRSFLILLYGLVALALWHAPVYGWLLLVSAWARRATFLWAVLSPLALCMVEKMAFDTSYLGSILKNRVLGFASDAFAFGAHDTVDSLVQLTPVKFLSAPGLWIGLAVAVGFLAAAVRLRRYREAI